MSDAEYRRRIVSLILAAQLTCSPVAQAAELLDRTTGTDPPSPNATYGVTEDTTVTPVESPSPSETASPRPPPITGGSTPTPVVSPSPTGKEEGERPSEKPEAEPTATPEAEPTATPEAEPTATPEVTPEVTPEAEPTATPEVTPEGTPEAEPTAMPEVTPEVMPEFAPMATPTATTEVMPEFKPILPLTGNQAPLFTMLGSPAVEEPLPVADDFPKLSRNSYADFGYYPYVGKQLSKADGGYGDAPYVIENSGTSVIKYTENLRAPEGEYGADKTVSFSQWSVSKRAEAVRVPDREFAGWYVHLEVEGEEDGSSPVAWHDVEKMGPNSYFKLEKDSTGAFSTTYGQIYDANPEFYRPDGEDDFTLRLIARWDLSSNADALESVTNLVKTEDPEGGFNTAMTSWETMLTYRPDPLEPPKAVQMWDEESKFGDSAQTTSFDTEIKEYWAFVDTNTTTASLNFLTAEPFATEEERGGVTVTVNDEPVYVKQECLNIGTTSYEEEGKYLSVNSVDNPASALWTATAENLLEAGDVPLTVDPNGAYNKVVVTITPPNGDTAKANTYTFWIQRAKTPEIKLEPGNTPAGLNQENAFSYAFDFDEDDSAVVVYTNDSFKLPSVTYVNSRGQELVNIPPQQPLELVVQVGLEVDSRAAGESENLLGMSYEWITGEKATTSVTLTAGSNGVWTIPQNVLPGKYPLTYKYKDPVSRLEAEDRIRWVIVLPRPGDADLDGVVTTADGWALQQVLDAVGTDSTKWTDLQKLYFYRVADVANENGTLLVSASGGPNGIVDEHDVYALYGGYVSSETMKYYGLFYQPLDGGKKNEVASSTGNTGEGNKGTLYLDYLGKGAENPLMSTTQYVPVKSEDNPVETGDVVWVGVRLDDRTALSSNLYSMSLTLLYDSRYLLPAYQDGEGNWQQVDITKPVEDTILDAWKHSLAQANQSTVWKDVTFAYAAPGDNYQQYDRKVPLSDEEKEHEEHLRELKVSYRSEIHGYEVNEENLLLVVPMLLHKQPPMADRLSALDLSLGSGNFSVKTHDTQAAAASQQMTMAWDGAGWLVDDENTNLSKLLNFDRAAATSATTLYLVDDPSNYTDLFAAADKSNWLYYGAPVPDNSYSFQGVNSTLVGTLPLGLSYDFQRGKILGTPLAAGEFTFLAGGVGYRITVHKRPLMLTPQPAEKYYGEENPTLTFRYDKDQIPEIDRPGGVNNPDSDFVYDGKGTELTYLRGYEEPVEISTTAETKSNVGKYSISLSGGLNKNYEFVFGADAELTIHQRPIYVNAITKNPIETVRVDTQVLSFTKEGSFTDGDFTAEKADLVNSGSLNLPLNGNAVVDGDDIIISYTATFQPDPNATEGNKFALSYPREDRTMAVTNFALIAGRGQNANYKLYRTDAVLVGTGSVVDRAVKHISFGGNAPANGLSAMEFTYGQKVDFNELTLILTYETDEQQPQKVETLTYTRPETLSDRGIHVVLLNHPSDDPTVPANVTAIASGDTMTYDKHNGTYFCVYMQTGLGAEARIVSAVSANAIQVAKRQLTLSLQRGAAYYGEDPNAPENLPTFTYERDALAPGEVAKLAALGIPTTGTGSAEELAQILPGYTAPTVEVWTAVPTVPNTTKLTAGADCREYFAILKDAQASNYSFAYTQYEISQGTRTDYGTSYYEVEPRPVVVQQLTMEPSSGMDGRYFLYDDTTSYTLKEMYYANGETRVPTALADGTGANTFGLALPAGTYFPEGGSSTGATSLKRPLTGTAIFSGDVSSLRVAYQATYVTDREIGNVPSNGNQWFQLADGNAVETRPVKISGLILRGEKAGNYKLVYATNDAAINRAPTNSGATGLVKLRAIEDMTIIHDPNKRSYIYGEPLDLNGMTLQLTYETQGDNVTLAHTVQSVVFRSLTINGAQTSNFEQLGFALSWEQWSGDVANYAPLQTARHGDYPTVAEHSGRRLVLTGRRHSDHPLKSGSTLVGITVDPKPLTLTVTDQVRYYGEQNGPYEATFLKSDLAKPDQSKVTNAQPKLDELENLSKNLNSYYYPANGYQKPFLVTYANQKSSVGKYTLAISGGKLHNYKIVPHDGEIEVQQRPIDIIGVAGTSASNPLYSIYHDDAQSNFTTMVKDAGSIYVRADSVHPTTGNAIVADDIGKVEFTVSFQYVNRPAFSSGDTVKPCDVNITGVALSTAGTSANYTIRSTAPNMKATAQLDNRPIDKIEVTKNPKLNYLYGEKLDLSEMMLKITYEGGGTEEKLAVREGRVSYYYSDIKDTISTHEVNIRGDHLTIAKDENGFAHQGKYLVGKASHAGKDTIFSVNDPIRITPLDLTYTLTANDKVYDGTTGTTGTVTLTNLYGNDKVTASAQFDFLDANVKYRTDGYTIDPGDDYWTMFQADPLRDSANWHEEQEVAAMPVLLSNIRLDGADKDNYTIALTEDSLDQAQKGSLDPNRNPVAQDHSIGLTDNLSSADRATVPFATITKADRMPTQAPAQVLVDDRTNVVKVDYNEQTAYQTIVTTSQNQNGVADDYAEEIHFEYVLELEQTDGTIRQWAGLDGSDSAQDGRFFGGEAVTPKAPVLIEGEGSGYVPDTEDFPSTEDMAEENFNYQGQIYRWAEEDAGFRLNTAAYPGGIYRPGYSLYETDRQPLPRAATVWVGVRVAATHNYNASSFLYSVSGETQLLRAQNAAAVADPVTQQRIDELKYYGEEEKWPNGAEVDTFAPEAHAAVNTYAQRLDLISVEEQDSAAEDGSSSDRERYNVYTLETVQFTDLMDYPEKQYMDGVVNGAGTANYNGYYWDENHSAELDFEGQDTDKPLDLRSPFTVTVEVKEENETREETVTVNVDNTAVIYVNLSSDSGLILEHSVEIDPSEIVACLGDEPLQLSAKVQPVTATFKSVTWSTSDPSVATVSRKGLVTFVGVGECVITARTRNGETATATVVVKLPEEPVETMGHFNLSYQGAYLWTNELGRVDPDRGLTRGELAQLFAQFCIAQEDAKVYEISFPDLEGKDYTVSVELLAALGIVNGTGTGYQGDQLATRAEAVTMLARMLCLDVSFVEDGDYAFGDSRPEDTWAWAYIEAMADAKLTNGVGESLFAPDRKITYAEVAVLLDRILERTHPNGEGVVLPDGMEADHWAYQSFVKGLNQAPVSENVSQ